MDVPLYGRYLPRPIDFIPDAKHIDCTTPESLEYWSTVLKKCTESNRIYESEEGGRDVFAVGGVIIKSSHLKETLHGRRSHRNYSYADANEEQAIALAQKVLGDVRVPQIYFVAQVLSNALSNICLLKTALILISTEQQPRCSCPRKNPGSRPQHSRAVPLAVSKDFLQGTSPRDTTEAAYSAYTS